MNFFLSKSLPFAVSVYFYVGREELRCYEGAESIFNSPPPLSFSKLLDRAFSALLLSGSSSEVWDFLPSSWLLGRTTVSQASFLDGCGCHLTLLHLPSLTLFLPIKWGPVVYVLRFLNMAGKASQTGGLGTCWNTPDSWMGLAPDSLLGSRPPCHSTTFSSKLGESFHFFEFLLPEFNHCLLKTSSTPDWGGGWWSGRKYSLIWLGYWSAVW